MSEAQKDQLSILLNPIQTRLDELNKFFSNLQRFDTIFVERMLSMAKLHELRSPIENVSICLIAHATEADLNLPHQQEDLFFFPVPLGGHTDQKTSNHTEGERYEDEEDKVNKTQVVEIQEEKYLLRPIMSFITDNVRKGKRVFHFQIHID